MAAVKITLGAALGPLQSGLRKASGMLRGFSGDATKLFAVGGVAATALGTALAVGLKDAIDLGGRMSDLAVQIGATAGQTAVLAAAFEANGMAADRMAGNINKMQKSIFAASQSDKANVFDKLGLDAKALIDMDPAQAFDEVLRGLSGISNVTERTGVAMEIFGKSGAEMLRLLSDPEAMSNARKQLGGMADLLDENAAKFDRVSDIMGALKSKSQGLFVGIGSEVIDQLLPTFEKLMSLDFSSVGVKIGKALSVGVEAFQSGQFSELIALSFQAGLEKVMNYFRNDFIPDLRKLLGESFSGIFDAMEKAGALFAKIKGTASDIGAQIGGLITGGLDGARAVAAEQRLDRDLTAAGFRGGKDPDILPGQSTAAQDALMAFARDMLANREEVESPSAPDAPDPIADAAETIKRSMDGLVTSMRKVGGEQGGRSFDMGINLEKEQLTFQKKTVSEQQTTNKLIERSIKVMSGMTTRYA